MANKPEIKSKMLKLKEWLTVRDAARHLSIIFDEEINEADVLRLSLDNYLLLSVYFVNEAHARHGRVVQGSDIKWPILDITTDEDRENINDLNHENEVVILTHKDLNDEILEKNVLYIGDEDFLILDEDVRIIEGIWNLPMIGNERLYVENKYQQLTGGPEVKLAYEDRTFVPIVGTFVEGTGGSMCQLQAKTQFKEYKTLQGKEKSDWSYVPAETLPVDSVLVVRTKSLIDLHERLTQVDLRKNKPLDSRQERTYLNIIGAFLEITTGTFKDENFTSETQLRDFIAEKFVGFRGATKRTLADKFALAKKAINDELS